VIRLALLLSLAGCGGGGAEPADAGTSPTTLIVAALPDDPDSVPSLALVLPEGDCAEGIGAMGMETMCAEVYDGVPTFTSWSFKAGEQS
jgi:hypothetical protein